MINYIKALSLLKASKTTIESENILSENSLNRISTKMFIQQIIFLQQIILPLMDMLLII